MWFETLAMRREGGVVFAAVTAPRMNLLGTALVRDRVSLIQQWEADDTVRVLVFKSADPDYRHAGSHGASRCLRLMNAKPSHKPQKPSHVDFLNAREQ